MFRLIFPPKCLLCRTLLTKEETDLCHQCREKAEVFTRAKRKIPFVAHWTALWYYKDNVRKSIHRFKFYGFQHYAAVYGRLLSMKLVSESMTDVDIISWVPISTLRKLQRGYDQSRLLARAVGKELGVTPLPVLRKIRHTKPQSSLAGESFRRANISGAYKVVDMERIAGKRILLLDDVVTTGATASECARMLMTYGAKEVYVAAIAAAENHKK